MKGKDESRPRKPYILVTLSNDEKEKLRQISERTGLSMRGFIRAAIGGWVPSSAPSADFIETMDRFDRACNQLFLLSVKTGLSHELQEAYEHFRKMKLEMESAYYLKEEDRR